MYNRLREVQQIVIFPGNRNRNRFTEPTSVQIGIEIFFLILKLQTGMGIVFVVYQLVLLVLLVVILQDVEDLGSWAVRTGQRLGSHC